MRPPSRKEIEAVTALAGPERYEHFIKIVVNFEEAWGLFEDGWAMAATDNDHSAFPLWPRAEYAQLCATGDWGACHPEAISLEDLLDDVLPTLAIEDIMPAIFMLPGGQAVTPTIDQLEEDLRTEMTRY